MCVQGVEYESRSINIRPELKATYNEACDVWYQVISAVLTLVVINGKHLLRPSSLHVIRM